MNAIILCGGLSTRLGDITKDIPKVLLPIGDRTVLDWQLGHLSKLGMTEVVLAAGHLARRLQGEVGGERGGIKIHYTIEEERLGTGGAIKFALASVPKPEEPTMIFNGDILSGVDYADMAARLPAGSDGIILATKVEDTSSYGTLVYDDTYKLLAFREKEGQNVPGFINGGMYFFTPSVAKYFPAQNAFSMEYDVFPRMTSLYVYESDRPWIDVGVPERLAWAREHWQDFLFS